MGFHTSGASAPTREQLESTGLGLKTQTFSPTLFVAGGGISSGQVAAGTVGLLAGDSITGLVILCTTLPNTPSLLKVGIYSSSLSRVAVSADFSASIATGYNSIPFTSPYSVTANGIYYLAYVCVGVNGGSLVRANSSGSFTGGAVMTSGGIRPYAAMTGQTDMPATLVPADTFTAFWFGAY